MNIGDQAPDFTLKSDSGQDITLYEELKKGPVVLIFYPKAFTPGCTKENCSFRDASEDLTKLGAIRIGISADSEEVQKKFSVKYNLGYPLLADTDKKVAKMYGVKRPGPLFSKRITFVISSDRKIAGMIHSEFSMDKHVNEVIEVLSALK
jgi:peroxiredoxin Q/BCP